MAILNTLMLAKETRTLTMNILARPGLQARYNCPMGESKPRDQGQGKSKKQPKLCGSQRKQDSGGQGCLQCQGPSSTVFALWTILHPLLQAEVQGRGRPQV